MKLGPTFQTLGLVLLLSHVTPAAGQGCAPQLNFAPFLTFCQGNSVTLNATNPNATYLWNTGDTTATLTITTSGTYWVTATNPCGTASDTIQVVVAQPLVVNLGPDFNLCTSGGSQLLQAPTAPLTTYQWQDGSTGSSYSVSTPGTYWVKVNNGCGAFFDTVTVGMDTPPVVSFGPDQQLCTGQQTTLSMTSTGGVLWSTGATTSSITVSTAGTYWGKVTNGCGTFSDTIVISFSNAPALNLPASTLLCNGTATLNAGSAPGTYAWSTGATGSQITVNAIGTYWVTLTTPCGATTDTIQVVNPATLSLNLGPDTTFCQGSITLNAQSPGMSVTWDNGSTGQTRTVSSSGTYWATVSNGCASATDTIVVTVIPNPANSLPDTLYTCAGTPFVVNLPAYGGFATYTWSNGQTGNPVNLSGQGSYSVTVTTPCGTNTEVVYLKEDQPLNPFLGQDTLLCDGTVELVAGLYAQTILWSNGASTPTIQVSTRGNHWVSLTNACGTYTDTIYVDAQPKPSFNFAPILYKCATGVRTLTLPTDTSFHYLWSTGDTTKTVTLSTPGTYWATVWNDCESVTDTFQLQDENPLTLNLGPDTTLCVGTPLTLGLPKPTGVSVLWSTGATTETISPTASGTYYCRWTNTCGPVYDTVVVTYLQAPLSPLPAEAAFCMNNFVALDATTPTANAYLWSTGDTTSSISVNQEGWYTVVMTNTCGTTTDSIFARQDSLLLPVNLGPDTVFCSGTVVLSPGTNPHVSYLWSTGATTPTLSVGTTGTYWVQVSNTCETRYDTINVLVTGPPALVLGTQVSFCQGTILTLNAQNPGSQYLWNTGATTQQLAISAAGKYWVTISNPCGSLTDTVDVVVENPLTLNLGLDTALCVGDTLVLDVQKPGAFYQWSTGATTPSITVHQTGVFWVEIWNSCGSRKDTLVVTFLDMPTVALPQDTVICSQGGSKVLSLSIPPFHTATWSNGSTGTTFTATQAGTYWVTLANACFSTTDTIVIEEEEPLVMDLGPDDTLCAGSVHVLSTGITDRVVTWNDGSTGADYFATQPGLYWATAANTCGPVSDTIVLAFQDAPVFPISDTVVCLNDSARLTIPAFEGSFVWADGDTSRSRNMWEAGTYTAFLTNVCGTFPRDYQVRKTNCDCDIYMANAFTPNGDGLNDRYVPGYTCEIRSFELRIFDRWGNQIFMATNPDETWDGTYRGQPAEQGVYTYKLFYIWDVYGEYFMREKTGRIAIIR